MNDTTTNSEANPHEWYFTENGQRQGPFTATALIEFLETHRISGDTSVRRKGLSEWQSLKSAELGAQLHDAPPPVAPSHINNAFV